MIRIITNRYGFTLAEIMLIFSILALFAGIMVPNFILARQQSHLTACCDNLKTISAALEAYAHDNNGKYPAGDGAAVLSKLVPKYIAEVPGCPSCGTLYNYEGPGEVDDNGGYIVRCAGHGCHRSVDVPVNYPVYNHLKTGYREGLNLKP